MPVMYVTRPVFENEITFFDISRLSFTETMFLYEIQCH